MKKRKTFLLASMAFLLVTWAAPALTREAYLSDIVVTNTRDHLLLYFTVNDCFTPDMNAAIESGINVTFTFFVELYEKRDFLWNRKIADMEISHSVKYDQLKSIYELRLSEHENKMIPVKDSEGAKRLMAEIVALKVAPLANLKRGGRYQLKMMAELDQIKLPFYLHYVLFFLSLWDFETPWYTVDFRY